MRLFRISRTLVLSLLVVASLTFNVATIAFSSLAVLLSGAFEAVTGAASVVGALRRDVDDKAKRTARMSADLEIKERRISALSDDVAVRNKQIGGLSSDLDRQTKMISSMTDDLTIKDRRIAALSGDLAVRNKQIGNLTDEVTSLRQTKTVAYRGQSKLLSEAVADTTDRVSRRTAVAAARNVGSVGAEAIPLAGIVVILGVTAWDLKDGCDTMKDLHELEVAFNPSAAFDPAASEVCGLEVPSKEEVWITAKSSPGKAWASAKAYVPDLPELNTPKLPELKFPEIDWKFWD